MKTTLAILVGLSFVAVAGAQNKSRDENPTTVPSVSGDQYRQKAVADLQKTHPNLYEDAMKPTRRHEAMNRILARLKKGEISKERAKEQLRPLVAEELTPAEIEKQIAANKRTIEIMERNLKTLEEAKEDPKPMIDRRVESLVSLNGLPTIPPGH